MSAILLLAATAWATPTMLIDDTPTGATVDGIFDSTEYATISTGINAGFGGPFGSAELGMDSDENGNLQIGLSEGQPNDFITLYIDARPGGITDTTSLNDGSDPHRAATSGVNISGGGGSNLFFAPGFRADVAVTCGGGLCVAYDITSPSMDFLGLADYSAGIDLEVELPASIFGLTAGGQSFDFVGTYGNPNDASGYFRSNEFHGAASVGVDNPGFDDVVLQAGDFSSFRTYCVDADGNGWCDTTLQTTAMSPGATTTLTLSDTPAGAQVLFFVSLAGPGSGPCAPASLGGACLGISNPIELGRSRANAAGVATVDFRVPNSAPVGTNVTLQAAWVSGGVSDVSALVPAAVVP